MRIRAHFIILHIIGAVLSFVLLGVLAIKIHFALLRHRAELPLADMQSIALRQTTFQQVQPLFARWRRWGTFEGACSEKQCRYVISLSEINTPENRFLYSHLAFYKLAFYPGLRITTIRAIVTVLDGRVWSEGIFFGVERPVQYPAQVYTEHVSVRR